MKKNLVLIVSFLFIFALIINGQTPDNNTSKLKTPIEVKNWFSLQKGVFVTNEEFITNDNKDYVVISAEGYSQKELFQLLLLGLNNFYTDIDKIVSKIEYDAITVNNYYTVKDEKATVIKVITGDNVNYYYVLGWHERFSFKFKDGKLRIDAPQVIKIDLKDINGKKISTKLPDLGETVLFPHAEITILKGSLYKLINDTFNKTDNDW